MVRAYSDDLRIRVVRAVEEGGISARSAGRRFGIRAGHYMTESKRDSKITSDALGVLLCENLKKSLPLCFG